MNSTVRVRAASAATSSRRGSSASIVALQRVGLLLDLWRIRSVRLGPLLHGVLASSVTPARPRPPRRRGAICIHESPGHPGRPGPQLGPSQTRSAAAPGASRPRSGRPMRSAGIRVAAATAAGQRQPAPHDVRHGLVQPQRRPGQRAVSRTGGALSPGGSMIRSPPSRYAPAACPPRQPRRSPARSGRARRGTRARRPRRTCCRSAIRPLVSRSSESAWPATPGSRWRSGRWALNRWVTIRAPRPAAAATCSAVASVWPTLTSTPAAVSRPMAASAPGRSGARVTSRSSPAGLDELTDRGRRGVGDPGLVVRAVAGGRDERALHVHAEHPRPAGQSGGAPPRPRAARRPGRRPER